MFKAAIFAALVAAPAAAQQWGELDCRIVSDYVAATRAAEGNASGYLASIRGHVPMDNRAEHDRALDLLGATSNGENAALLATLLRDRCPLLR